MNKVVFDFDLVGNCGAYCGACASYRRGKCPGCEERVQAGECRIRTCCDNNMYPTCASCTEYVDIRECKIFNSLFSKVIDYVKRSDRHACVEQIREIGLERHAARMANLGRVTMRRGRTAEK